MKVNTILGEDMEKEKSIITKEIYYLKENIMIIKNGMER